MYCDVFSFQSKKMISRTVFCAASAVLTLASMAGCAVDSVDKADPPVATTEQAYNAELSGGVVGCAQRQIGNRIGDGQCTALVNNALSCARACTASNYIWGDPEPAGVYRSGDIIQFEGVVWSWRYPNGSTRGGNAPHHSAVIESFDGTTLSLIEQNNAGSPTQRGIFVPAGRTQGTIAVFSPKNCGTPTPPTPSSGKFAAIAYSPSTQDFGRSWGFGSAADANASALTSCRAQGHHASDCSVVVWLEGACGAVAGGPNGRSGSAWNSNVYTARTMAMTNCGAGCWNVASVCGDGSGQ